MPPQLTWAATTSFVAWPQSPYCLAVTMDQGIFSVIHNTPFKLQVVSPAVTRIWGNVPVLGSLPDIRMRPSESVVNRPLPCKSYQSFEIFEVSMLVIF